MQSSVASVVGAISRALVGDPATAAGVTQSVVEWLDAHRDEVGAHDVAWGAARAVTESLAAVGAGAPPGLPVAQLRLIDSLPVATQVTAALHHLAGLDVAATAAATSRPPEEVVRLLDDLRTASAPPPPADAPPAPRADAPPADAPPAPPPDAAPPADAPPPPPPRPVEPLFGGDPGSAPSRPHRRRGRRRSSSRRVRPWMVAVAAAVAALVVGGIVASALRPDAPRRERAVGGVGDSVSVTRSQLSKGCETSAGDAELEAQVVNLRSGDAERSYRIIAPPPLTPGQPRPLIVDFGDLGQSLDAQAAAAQLDAIAVALKAVVVTVAPARGFPQWNVLDAAGDPDDIGLTNAIIERESRRLCIDQTRMIVAGQGAGAHFAAAYACTNTDAIAGMILVAGAYHPPRCDIGDGPISVLAVLGAEDDVFPLNGGSGPGFERAKAEAGGLNDGSVYRLAPPQETLDRFARDLDCAGTATMPLGLVSVRIATSCDGDAEVWRVVLDGAGHEWYGATNELILRFMTEEGPLGTR